MINKCLNLYKKYQEIINYLIIGVLTTLVSIGAYFIFAKVIGINYIVSNVISWTISVAFAYITNKVFVFKNEEKDKKKVLIQIYQFVKYRLLSLVIDVLLLYLFVELIKMNDMIAKVINQVIVIVLNYVFSKLFVFKKSDSK
ncbi:MAG: GtrA family protein [Clostridium sp.]|nr:GtrA family protein [Clostridium sp.]MCM1444515.1 GtrA family protein [Candidatus Amulumruptor caecigallinarius]